MERNAIDIKRTTISDKKNNGFFIIVIIAMFFAPFTSLRYLRVGFTEISCLLLAISVVGNNYNLNIKKKNEFIFTKFWLFFCLLSSFGLLYNYVFLNKPSGTVTDMLFDSVAYIIAFVTCFSLEIIIYNNKLKNIELLIKNIFYSSSFILMILFILSRFVGEVGGLQLRDLANNFKPLADNIHHVAMFVGPLPFIGLYFFVKETSVLKKIIIIIFLFSDVIIIFNTGSSKAIMGLVLGIFVIAMKKIIELLNNVKKGYFISLIFICLVMAVLIMNLNFITPFFIQIFVENDGGGARASLYSIGLEKSLDSIFIGYGPGKHSLFAGGISADTHQTFLTVLLQSGIFGLFAYFFLLLKVVNVYWKNTYLLGASCSIFIYILGGDVLRRLPIWIFMILFYYLIKENYSKQENTLKM